MQRRLATCITLEYTLLDVPTPTFRKDTARVEMNG